MDLAQIAAQLEPFLEGCPTSRGFRDVGSGLSPTQLEQTSTYIDLLLRWNARINLTAIRTPEEIVTRHFGESFFLARHLFPANTNTQTEAAPPFALFAKGGNSAAPRVLDLGSGAGFPALPLKIWAPQIHLTLIESNHKKAAFLREVARALILTDINVCTDRVETLAARPEFPKADVVTLRAIEKFERILPVAATFLAPQTRLALLITTAQLPHLTTLPTLTWQTIPVPQSDTRVLSIGVQSTSGK